MKFKAIRVHGGKEVKGSLLVMEDKTIIVPHKLKLDYQIEEFRTALVIREWAEVVPESVTPIT